MFSVNMRVRVNWPESNIHMSVGRIARFIDEKTVDVSFWFGVRTVALENLEEYHDDAG